MSAGPNPLMAAWSMVRAQRFNVPSPTATSSVVVDHGGLEPVLNDLGSAGVPSLVSNARAIVQYRDHMQTVEPDRLNAPEALSYWMNLYNAGALSAAGSAFEADESSVLRIPGVFTAPWSTVGGETLSLNDIEHGKIRRFGDPRIHGGLVCGSASCPTLRAEPYSGRNLDFQLDDQLRSYIAHGGGQVSQTDDTLWLSSVFKWYGGDFTRPHTMPNISPPTPDRLRSAVAVWFTPSDAEYIWETRPRVKFMPYDWGLGCSVG